MICRDVRERAAAWIDDELGPDSALDLQLHLERCEPCRALVERQRRFGAALASLHPRPAMPEASRRALFRRLGSGRRRRGLLALAVAAGLAAVVVPGVRRGPGLPAEVEAAVAVQAAAERDRPPLAVVSGELPAVNRWLRDELPFAGTIAPGIASLRLEGASAVDLGDARAAWVLYRRGNEPVSLFVLPPRRWPDVGRVVVHRGVEFRTMDVGGHRVVAWSHDPVSYLLVSSTDRPAAEACAVCHVGRDAPAIAGFRTPS